MSWQIQARYSEHAKDLIHNQKRVSSGLFWDWTSVSDFGTLEDTIYKYVSGIHKDTNLYQYQFHNTETEETIPCEIIQS